MEDEISLLTFKNTKENASKISKFVTWRNGIRPIYRDFIVGPVYSLDEKELYFIMLPAGGKELWNHQEYIKAIREKFLSFDKKAINFKYKAELE